MRRLSTSRVSLQQTSHARCVVRGCVAHVQYRIEPRIRSHTSVTRDRLIPLVASCVPESHRADLSKSEVVILVEIFKNVCGIGALEDYEELGKMNVQTLVQRTQRAAHSESRVGREDATDAAADQRNGTPQPDAS